MPKKHIIPSRLNGEDNPEYMDKWKTEHPEQVRASNRKSSAKWRQRDEWKEYLRNWRREWYTQGNNAYLQYLRSVPSCIKQMLKKGKGQKMRKDTIQILENLEAIGWDIETTLHINHKCSLYWLIQINPDLPKTVAYDKINLELITKASNHSLDKREVGRRTLEAARAMESKYPDELKGLVKLIKKNLGEVK